MSDFIIIDGDTASFLPTFGAATVVVQPGTITGSGASTFNGSKVCVEGDESSVEVPGCMYMTPVYSIPGTGTLKIDSLAGDQLASHTLSDGKAMILKGSTFQAKFEVQSPAQQPPPGPGSPIPDSMTTYTGGSGMFISSNTKYKGT
ncbi:MAG: hypothetical protein D6730_20695 [Bacteroidetes bacterium]|nr:MAG: hypothetical protein D6730_20695 [Bacteroidota bacterium]